MKNLILQTKNLTAGYDNKIILQNVNFKLYDDDFIAIIGPNGGGKSTLLKTILGLLPIIDGEILFYDEGKEIKQLKIGYLPQYHAVDKRFPLTSFEVIHSGFLNNQLFNFKIKGNKKKIVKEIAEKLSISNILNSPINKLSGGQLQKVFLGRAIANSPKLLVLDEPNTYVDSQFEGELYEMLKELNQEMAILMVSHDLGTISSYVKSIACINRDFILHESNELSQEIIDTYNCPIDMITHGHIPHRVLPTHTHKKDS